MKKLTFLSLVGITSIALAHAGWAAGHEGGAGVFGSAGGFSGGHTGGVALFDVYRGAPLSASEKSLAWRLVFQSTERTLTDAEVDANVAAITRSVAAIGGRIRT